MSQENVDSNTFLSSNSSKNALQSRSRGQSCSPTREIKMPNSSLAFSTIRRTRSPYRKQNLDNFQDIEYKGASHSRPPIPRKFKNAQSVTDECHQPRSMATLYKGKTDVIIKVSNNRTKRILVCAPTSCTNMCLLTHSYPVPSEYKQLIIAVMLYSTHSNNNYLASEGHYNSTQTLQ